MLERIPPTMAERFARVRTQYTERNRRIGLDLSTTTSTCTKRPGLSFGVDVVVDVEVTGFFI